MRIPSNNVPGLLEDENRRLKRAVEELSILNDLAQAIGASSNPDAVMQTIIRRALRAVQAEQGVITMVDHSSDDRMKTLVRAMGSSSEHEHFHLTQALTGWMLLNKKPLLLNTPGSDARFSGVRWDPSIRSLLCVPLMIKSEVKGVLTILNKKDEQGFTEGDQRLLAILAAQSAQVVENARLTEMEKAAAARKLLLETENARKTKELEDARTLQLAMLPREIPRLSDYDIAVFTRTAAEVGGDYYDFGATEAATDVALGDAIGHGMQAGTLVTLMKGLFAPATSRVELARFFSDCSRAIKQIRLGRMLMGLAVVRLQGDRISIVNAGMPPVLLFTHTTGTVEEIMSGSMPLGAKQDVVYPATERMLGKDDILLLCSDGLPELKNPAGEMFGYERIHKILLQHAGQTAAEIVNACVGVCDGWLNAAQQDDDITLIVIKKR